jgi:hypothetical protein
MIVRSAFDLNRADDTTQLLRTLGVPMVASAIWITLAGARQACPTRGEAFGIRSTG